MVSNTIKCSRCSNLASWLFLLSFVFCKTCLYIFLLENWAKVYLEQIIRRTLNSYNKNCKSEKYSHAWQKYLRNNIELFCSLLIICFWNEQNNWEYKNIKIFKQMKYKRHCLIHSDSIFQKVTMTKHIERWIRFSSYYHYKNVRLYW